MLPIRAMHTEAREHRIAAYLATLPPGATVTVCQVLREVPCLRLLPTQGETVAATLRALGWRAGKGRDHFVREGEAPAPVAARLIRLHPEVARCGAAIRAFLDSLPPGGTTTEAEVCQAAGVKLAGQERRAVGRHLRRMGWRPLRRGSPLYRQEGAA